MLFMTNKWRSSSAVMRRRLSLSMTYSMISLFEYHWSWKRLTSAILEEVVCCTSSVFLFFFLLLSLFFFFLPSEISFKCVLTSSWLTTIELTIELQVSFNLVVVLVLFIFVFPFKCIMKKFTCCDWLGRIDSENCSACGWLCSRCQNSLQSKVNTFLFISFEPLR